MKILGQKPSVSFKKVVTAGIFPLFCIVGFHIGPTSGITSFLSSPTQRPSKVEVFDPDRQREISAESEDLVISLARVEVGDDGRRAFIFELKDKRQGTKKSFRVSNDTAQVDEIVVINSSRAIVLGSASGTVRVVNVIDLRAGSVIDFFYCHFPSVYGRFIAYVRFVPRYFAQPGLWSYVYLVYDATASPAQNRLYHGRRFEDSEKVGIPIYPLENFERKVYEPVIASEEDTHQLASDGLFWLQEGVVAFVDRWKKMNHLVVVDVRFGITQPKIKVIPIDTAAVLDLTRCGDDVEHPENLIHVQEIYVPKQKAGYVRLHFSPRDSCLRSSILDLPIR